jgi:hypothetical protein
MRDPEDMSDSEGGTWLEARVFASFADFAAECMLPDHETFGAGNA